MGAFYGVVFCLNISTNFLVACYLVVPTDENWDVEDQFYMASIRSSATLVAAY